MRISVGSFLLAKIHQTADRLEHLVEIGQLELFGHGYSFSSPTSLGEIDTSHIAIPQDTSSAFNPLSDGPER